MLENPRSTKSRLSVVFMFCTLFLSVLLGGFLPASYVSMVWICSVVLYGTVSGISDRGAGSEREPGEYTR